MVPCHLPGPLPHLATTTLHHNNPSLVKTHPRAAPTCTRREEGVEEKVLEGDNHSVQGDILERDQPCSSMKPS